MWPFLSLASALSHMLNLRIRDNDIRPEGAAAIAAAMTVLTSLTSCNLRREPPPALCLESQENIWSPDIQGRYISICEN